MSWLQSEIRLMIEPYPHAIYIRFSDGNVKGIGVTKKKMGHALKQD